ncbi:MAG: hypothetical protein ACK4F6_08015 [Hylemonella sp.]
MRRPELGAALALLLAISALPAQAEYCVNYSSRVMSLARQAGSMNTRGCVATESQCNSARMSRPTDYSGICYYVPGMYPPTPGKQGGAAPGGDQGAKSSAEAQKKIRAQQQAQDQAEQRAAQQARQDLLGGLKGVESSSGLTIKLPPAPVGGTARAQLDCVARASASSTRENAARLGPGVPVQGGQDDFENGEDCRPVATPAVPEASPPVPVAEELPRDTALLARLLASLLARQREVQQQLASQDRDIARREAELAREEQAPKVDLKTAPAESDALRRAREALAKARADRQKTAAEYEKLQQQAQQARQQQANPDR